MFRRLLLLGGLLVAAGVVGGLVTGGSAGDRADDRRLAIAVTDAKELRCVDNVAEWEVQADVVTRDFESNSFDAAQLVVAYWQEAGGARRIAPVRVVEPGGFRPGVVTRTDTAKFQPVVRVALPCGSDAAQLTARVEVAGETLEATDEFLSSGVAMASPIVIGTVIIGVLGLGVLAARR